MTNVRAWFFFLSVLLLTGCPDKRLRKSIKQTAAGQKAFSESNHGLAEQYFKDAVISKQSNHAAHYGLGLIYTAKAASTRDATSKKITWQKARDAFASAVEHGPKFGMYHFFLGRAEYELGNYEKARAELARAVEISPELYRAHYYLGKALLGRDKHKEAAEALNAAIEAYPGYSQAVVDLAQLYISWDYLDPAIKVLEGNAGNLPDKEGRKNAYYNLGFAHQLKKKYSDAEAAYTKALEIDATFTDAKLRRGVVRRIRGKIEEGNKDLDEVLKGGKLSPKQRAMAMRYRHSS